MTLSKYSIIASITTLIATASAADNKPGAAIPQETLPWTATDNGKGVSTSGSSSEEQTPKTFDEVPGAAIPHATLPWTASDNAKNVSTTGSVVTSTNTDHAPPGAAIPSAKLPWTSTSNTTTVATPTSSSSDGGKHPPGAAIPSASPLASGAASYHSMNKMFFVAAPAVAMLL